jgi:CRP/FNR family cyclic AMP-dependent transcriptional regulator
MTESHSIFSQLRNVLRETYFFQSLKVHELDELIGGLRMIRVQKDYEIIRQGEGGDAFYLVASGKVSVWVKKGFHDMKKVAELSKDDFFGEMALISNDPRSATVKAEEVTELFVLQRQDFDRILMKNPVIAQEIRKAFVERKHKNA